MNCVDLEQQFGDRYKVTYEESHGAERREIRAAEAPWLMVIPCQHGKICPWSGGHLAACTFKNGSVASRLRNLPFVSVRQDGADGINAVFHVAHFDTVAKIMKPKRRRRGRPLSEEKRKRLIEAGKRYRFRTGRRAPRGAQISTIGASGE